LLLHNIEAIRTGQSEFSVAVLSLLTVVVSVAAYLFQGCVIALTFLFVIAYQCAQITLFLLPARLQFRCSCFELGLFSILD
jgi:hypothetical protein